MAQAAIAEQKVPWIWTKNNCQNCGISFQIIGDLNSKEDMESKEKAFSTSAEKVIPLQMVLKKAEADAKARSIVFMQTLSNQKQNILNIYANEINSQEYNLLAHMAVGILGQESRFFSNWRYAAKMNVQWLITEKKIFNKISFENDLREQNCEAPLGPFEVAKCLLRTEDAVVQPDDVAPNSKGPTQIKKVPERIAIFYNIKEENLWNPKYAAVSTMGYLIEALKELRQRAYNNKWNFINDYTIVDYLPYLYFGGVKKLKNGSATPDKNIYVKNMKRFMGKVKVYEIIP